MSNPKSVVLTLGSQGKWRNTIPLSQSHHLILATGQDFVRVGLMSYIPDKLIVWCVKNIVQRNS